MAADAGERAGRSLPLARGCRPARSSIAWVKRAERESRSRCSSRAPASGELHERLLDVYNSRDRIPGVTKRGDWLYNFWQDAANPRGVLRRTTLDGVPQDGPGVGDGARPRQALRRGEREVGLQGRAPASIPNYERCLVSLSRGGADAVEVREFDLEAKRVREGRLPRSRIQGRRRLARRRHALRRARFRSRHDHALGLPAHGEGMEARHAARRRRRLVFEANARRRRRLARGGQRAGPHATRRIRRAIDTRCERGVPARGRRSGC